MLTYIFAKKTREPSAEALGRARRIFSVQKVVSGSGIKIHHSQKVEHRLKRRFASETGRFADFGNEGANVNLSFDDPETELWTSEIEIGAQMLTQF
jgi:hypothetical protein